VLPPADEPVALARARARFVAGAGRTNKNFAGWVGECIVSSRAGEVELLEITAPALFFASRRNRAATGVSTRFAAVDGWRCAACSPLRGRTRRRSPCAPTAPRPAIRAAAAAAAAAAATAKPEFDQTIQCIGADGAMRLLAGDAGRSGRDDGTSLRARFTNPTGIAVWAPLPLAGGDRAVARVHGRDRGRQRAYAGAEPAQPAHRDGRRTGGNRARFEMLEAVAVDTLV
jgi:hypothetical protein